MKTIIIYATNYGTTEKCAYQLKDQLEGEVTIVNIRKQKLPLLDEFDTIIIGGSIRAGKIQKAIKKLARKHLPILLKKKVGLFVCCMERGIKAQLQFENAFPAPLRVHALASGFFGGEFYLERMNWLERLIIKKISGMSENVSLINNEAIREFVQKINQKAEQK